MQRFYAIIEIVCVMGCLSTGVFATTCESGYTAVNISAKETDWGNCFDSGFARYDTPNLNFSDLYYIIPDDLSSSRYVQGSCDSDEYTVAADLSTGQIGGKCASSYAQVFISPNRNIDIIHDNVASFDQGSCPTGFYDATAVTGVSVSPVDAGVCGSGNAIYTFEDMCRGTDTSIYVCPLLCESGGEYTDMGTCEICPAGMTELEDTGICYSRKLHIDDKIVYLKSIKSTEPSLIVRLNGNTHYANLTLTPTFMTQGASDYLKIMVNGVEYYACDDTICGDLK